MSIPSIGLITTSIAFFIPALIAKRRKRKSDAIIISTLATSSILYHGTLHPRAHLFDVIIAHSTAINYLFLSIKNLLKYRKKIDFIAIFFGGLSTHMYYRKSLLIKNETISRKWHMKVHVSAQLALLAFLFGSSQSPTDNSSPYTQLY